MLELPVAQLTDCKLMVKRLERGGGGGDDSQVTSKPDCTKHTITKPKKDDGLS